ncbi:DUF1617 family protein [Peribacillus muralis]|uniref:DUF1617 family protein n=1 Tax=Peribacillus muralis TaxID=264697 RepID=UPI003D03C3DC
MKVQIQYSYIAGSIEFLYNLSLKGKQSRHRTRFIKALQEKLQEVSEEEIALLKEYAGEDEEGNPKKNKQGNFDIKDVQGFKKQQEELFAEQYVCDGGDVSGMLKTVKDILLNYDEEVSGQVAEVYDYLCEQFEKGEDQ